MFNSDASKNQHVSGIQHFVYFVIPTCMVATAVVDGHRWFEAITNAMAAIVLSSLVLLLLLLMLLLRVVWVLTLTSR